LTLDWRVQEDELVIGRAAVCDIVLEDRTVSRRHARLACRDGTWIVHDLDSTNGTFVNGATVGRCQLRPGDRLCLGDQAVDVD
jgi:pSer/pThr/pTyr-binding forkhead associated (FHA) protein